MPDSPASAVTTSGKPAHDRRSSGDRKSKTQSGDNLKTSSQEAPAAQAEVLKSLLALIPDSIICLDQQWRITFANAEARRLSRIQDSDLNSKTHWELYPETVGTQLDLTYRRVMQTGTPAHIEYFYQPYNRWLDIQVLPILEGIALYYRDISDRKRVEKLRESANRQFQQVLDTSPDSIVCIDRNWICTFANRAASVILKSNDLIGSNLWTTFPGNQQEPFISNYRAAMEQRVPTEFEAYYSDPLDVWFRVIARPYEDGIIIFATDITSRKKAEARRDTTSRQLQQVFEATHDAVISLSRDWTFTFLNRRARELLAVKGDLIGRNFWEEFPAAAQTGNYLYFYNRAMYERLPGEFEDSYPDPLNIWIYNQCMPSDDGIVVFFRDITTERASKQKLLDQQEVLSFVQQTARVATWEMDLTTRKMTFSDGSYPVFGRPCSEITTIDQFETLIYPSDLPCVLKASQEALRTGQINIIDYRVITSEGATLWVESRRVPIYNDAEVATHLRGMTNDITSRKQNEEKLAASEERYRVLADLNPQAIWMGDPAGNITYANQGFLDYIGLTMDAASDGLTWLNPFLEEDRKRVLDTWTHSITTGVEYDIEARMTRASDGAVRWWWLRARPIRDEAGNILNWLGVAMDIHDRKTYAEVLRAEQQETERQRAELESIYETAPIGLALFDPVEFRYLRVNDRQAETLGLPKDQIIGRCITEIAPLKGLLDLFQQVAAGVPVRNQLLEGELPTRPGEHRYWNVSYSPVYTAEGTIEAIAAVVQEITNQKKSENALIQSEKLAAVGRLASSISHEINNPLEAITNILYLVALDKSLPEDLKVYVNMAQSELSRVCQIATQTLRFHRQAVRATRVTAEDLVAAVVNLYQGRLSNSGISVEVTYSSSTPILCFENDIRQVLNNLIANAIDAMRPSGGHLLIRAHNTTARTAGYPNGISGIRITIADTGHGMPPHTQARIFEPFYTTKDLNGTGLGLWISSGIINRHKGRLTFRSSTHPLHHGTVFALFLPHEVEPENAQSTPKDLPPS